jgi:hypothetical protein
MKREERFALFCVFFFDTLNVMTYKSLSLDCPPPLLLLKEKIFSPFSLLENSSEEKEKGTLKINPTTT